jgi:hypothetical protein
VIRNSTLLGRKERREEGRKLIIKLKKTKEQWVFASTFNQTKVNIWQNAFPV